MPRKTSDDNALYVSWKLHAESSESARARLSNGEGLNLYALRSWVIANGQGRALIAPTAPLEEIAEAMWENPQSPVASRWVAGKRACADLAREIETMPVSLGLAPRPEEWPFSSAAER